MFKSIKAKIDPPRQEEETLKFWDDNKIFEKSVGQRSDEKTFYFYDGPPFATGLPHYGHLIAGAIKDAVPRYQTMLGAKVERRFGWDCHGLPVEFEVEKELGLKGAADIRKLGVDKFNEKCRSIVLRYSEQWRKTVRRIGRWIDMDNDYKTMEPDFMESIWWVFKELWDKGLVYESKKIVAYSPRLSTPLSNFEVNQGYQDVKDPSVTIKFPLKGQPKTCFLAWTTTPWTLISNLALSVHPEITYVKVELEGEHYYLAEALIKQVFGKDSQARIIDTFKGEELAGLEYEPLFPYFKDLSEKGAFRVFTGEHVTVDTGTGIVHTAPSFGEDDFTLGEKNGLPHVFPMDDEGRFNEEAPEFTGLFFKDADIPIMRKLKAENLLFKKESVVHPYPFCWRSGAPLMYRTIRSWFVNVKKIKENLIKNNQKINWFPAHIQNGRMGKWLEGSRDWAISRNRFWGNPIPVWICDECKHQKCVGSKKELEELSGAEVKDLHSHFIDHLSVKCEKCGGTMKRTSEVLDCWFESGSMPYGQEHYPFEKKEEFDKKFPADFISEGLDQTRGWFYTLMVLSSALFGKPAFKNCVVNGLVLAEDGKKMSKSLKNFPDPWDMLNKYGADVIRLYMLSSGAVQAEDLQFSENGLRETIRNSVIPLWNALSFFTTYANIDKWTPIRMRDLSVGIGVQLASGDKSSLIEFSKKYIESFNPLDRWILSRLQKLISEIRKQMSDYNLSKAGSLFIGFIDHLTNWYIRRGRRRFWKAGQGEDKNQAYSVLYSVLIEFSKIIAPFTPFISENIYQILKTENMPESVHLCLYPEINEELRDKNLEEEMDIILRSVNMGRALRAKHQLKIRQPLGKIVILSKSEAVRDILGDMSALITEELNIKKAELAQNEEDLVVLSAKPNLRVLGPQLGKKLKQLTPQIQSLSHENIADIQNGGKAVLKIDGRDFEVGLEQLFIQKHQKEGIVSESDDKITVALDTRLTPELVEEGYAREFVNKAQQTRKELDFEVSDRVKIHFHSGDKLKKALEKHADYIKTETLSDELTFFPDEQENFAEWMINDLNCRIRIIKN